MAYFRRGGQRTKIVGKIYFKKENFAENESIYN
jgi:hypothetical protein